MSKSSTLGPTWLESASKTFMMAGAVIGAVTVILNVGPCDASWKFVERSEFESEINRLDSSITDLKISVGKVESSQQDILRQGDKILEKLNENSRK